MSTHVFIGTTQGPVAVQRITAEDSGIQSVICFNGTVESLPISTAYQNFVRRGTGVIARDFGHDAFRIDVDGRIDQGVSWQLPIYIAHRLLSLNDLGDGQPQIGDRVIWATGEVGADGSVRSVERVADKLSRSMTRIRAWREQGIEVEILLPHANLTDTASLVEELAGVSGLGSLSEMPAPIGKPRHAGARATGRPRIQRRWLLLGALVLLLALVLAFWPSQTDHTPEQQGPDLDLDDFGPRARPTSMGLPNSRPDIRSMGVWWMPGDWPDRELSSPQPPPTTNNRLT